jgi:hypothetical protein
LKEKDEKLLYINGIIKKEESTTITVVSPIKIVAKANHHSERYNKYKLFEPDTAGDGKKKKHVHVQN